MRLDVMGAALLFLAFAGTGGAALLLVLAPAGPAPLCPQVHLVHVPLPGAQAFEVDQASPRATVATWIDLQPQGEAVQGFPHGFWNLHDVVRRAEGRPWFEDRPPLDVVSPGDRFVVPTSAPLRLTVFDDSGRGIGGLEGCGSADLRVQVSPSPGACYGVHLAPEQAAEDNATVFRVAGARGTWFLHEVEYHAPHADAFLSGNLTAITAASARPVRFEDAAPLGEVSVGDRFLVEGTLEGLSLVEAATGRGIGGSWLCL